MIALRKTFVLLMFAAFLPLLYAQERRAVPLDLYLIIDGSLALERSRTEIADWVNEQVANRILMDGDSVTVWAAGGTARIIHSSVISGDAGRAEVAESIRSLQAAGQTADFAGAMTDVASRLAQRGADRSRLPHTMLITASAAGLIPAFAGGAQHLFRWFRSEHSAQWQVLVMAPNIGTRVQQAAAAYMASQR